MKGRVDKTNVLLLLTVMAVIVPAKNAGSTDEQVRYASQAAAITAVRYARQRAAVHLLPAQTFSPNARLGSDKQAAVYSVLNCRPNDHSLRQRLMFFVLCWPTSAAVAAKIIQHSLHG